MDLEQKAIERIKTASEMSIEYYKQPLICTYSGGKDSDVLLELFKRSGVPFEVQHSHTTADAPQTVWHVRDNFKKLEEGGIKCSINYPRKPDGTRITMWNLIPRKLMPPTRLVRYCCKELKETAGMGRYVATGVRWDESTKRKHTRSEFEKIGASVKTKESFDDSVMLNNDNNSKRRITELCMQKHKMVVNPIVDWKEEDIWNYIDQENICVNKLYQCGYKRVGCIGCPMAGRKGKLKEFYDFPTFKLNYIRAFDRMLEVRKAKNLPTQWESGEEVFLWWIEDKNVAGQREFKVAENGQLMW